MFWICSGNIVDYTGMFVNAELLLHSTKAFSAPYSTCEWAGVAQATVRGQSQDTDPKWSEAYSTAYGIVLHI